MTSPSPKGASPATASICRYLRISPSSSPSLKISFSSHSLNSLNSPNSLNFTSLLEYGYIDHREEICTLANNRPKSLFAQLSPSPPWQAIILPDCSSAWTTLVHITSRMAKSLLSVHPARRPCHCSWYQRRRRLQISPM